MGDIRPNFAWVLVWIAVGGSALALVSPELFGTGSLQAAGGFVAAALAAAVWSWLKDQRELEPEERAGALDAFGPGFVAAAVALLAIAAALGLAWLEIAFTSAGVLMTWFALRSRERAAA